LKHEQPTDAFQRLLLAGRRRRRERLKARGGTAAELMSWPVITIGPEAEVAEAGQAAAQAAHRAAAGDRRLRPAGRHCQPLRCVEDLPSPDSDIRRDVLDQVIFGGLVPAPERIQVRVRDGVVLLEGTCQRRGLIPVLVRAVAGVEGSCGSRTGSASAWTTSPRR
jgi:hypothetical protein